MVPRCFSVAWLAAMFLMTEADPIPKTRPTRYAPAYIEADHDAQSNDAFAYGVYDPHTGDKKSQWEQRYGDVVKGSYSLAEPDGTIRVVDYAADSHSGFNAVVKRYGTAVHPITLQAKPIVVAPIVNNAIIVQDPVSIPGPTPIIPSALPLIAPVSIPRPAPIVALPVSQIPAVNLPSPPPPPFTVKIQRRSKGDIFGPGKKHTYYIYVDPASIELGTIYLRPTFTRKTKGKYSTGWVPVKGKKLSRQLGQALAEI